MKFLIIVKVKISKLAGIIIQLEFLMRIIYDTFPLLKL